METKIDPKIPKYIRDQILKHKKKEANLSQELPQIQQPDPITALAPRKEKYSIETPIEEIREFFVLDGFRKGYNSEVSDDLFSLIIS